MAVTSNYVHNKSAFYGSVNDTKPINANIGSIYTDDSGTKYEWTGTKWQPYVNTSSTTINNEVQSGGAFTLSKTMIGVASGGNFDVVITSGSKPLHFVIQYTSEDKAYFSTYINTVFTGGTQIIPFNRNTSSSETLGATIKQNPTITTIGTQRGNDFCGSTGGVGRSGDTGGYGLESILQPNTNFLIRLTNAGSQAKDLNLIVNMYES